MKKPKHKVKAPPPAESYPAVYRVEFDEKDEPVIEKLLVIEGKEHYRLRTEAGQVVYEAPYLSVRVQRTLGSTPQDALKTRIAALESNEAQARAELATVERQLERARARLAKLSAGKGAT